jgi:Zn-dependent protease with chaperone function
VVGPPTAFDAIRPLLPVWVGWGAPLLWLLGGFLAGCVSTSIGVRVAIGPLRRLAPDASWVERARLAHPCNIAASGAALAPAILIAAVSVHAVGPLSVLPAPALAIGSGIATCLGSFVVRWRLTREIQRRETPFLDGLAGELVAWTLLLPHLMVMLAMIATIDREPGVADAVLIAAYFFAFLGLSWAGGLPLLRAIGAARPAGERLARIVTETASNTGVVPRGVFVVRWPVANALALPMSRQLVFTERILEALDEPELAAITAHELGHLSEPRSVKLGRVLGVFILFPIGLATPVVHAVGVPGALGVLAICLIAGLLVQRMARLMEERADDAAHHHEGDPGTFARGLEKLYEANLHPVVTARKRPVHPHLYDRLLAAAVAPGYPRPEPPGRLRTAAALTATCVGFAVLLATLLLSPGLAARFGDPGAGLARAIALSGGDEGMHDLALRESRRGEFANAIALLEAAAAVDPEDHHSPAYAASLHAWGGDCGAASGLLARAESRASPEQRVRCGWIEQARGALEACPVELSRAGSRRDPGAI